MQLVLTCVQSRNGAEADHAGNGTPESGSQAEPAGAASCGYVKFKYLYSAGTISV